MEQQQSNSYEGHVPQKSMLLKQLVTPNITYWRIGNSALIWAYAASPAGSTQTPAPVALRWQNHPEVDLIICSCVWWDNRFFKVQRVVLYFWGSFQALCRGKSECSHAKLVKFQSWRSCVQCFVFPFQAMWWYPWELLVFHMHGTSTCRTSRGRNWENKRYKLKRSIPRTSR